MSKRPKKAPWGSWLWWSKSIKSLSRLNFKFWVFRKRKRPLILSSVRRLWRLRSILRVSWMRKICEPRVERETANIQDSGFGMKLTSNWDKLRSNSHFFTKKCEIVLITVWLGGNNQTRFSAVTEEIYLQVRDAGDKKVSFEKDKTEKIPTN